jgi:hypothetical protein
MDIVHPPTDFERIVLILMLRAIPPASEYIEPHKSGSRRFSRRLFISFLPPLAGSGAMRKSTRRGEMVGATHYECLSKKPDLTIQRFRTDHGLIAANGTQACWQRSRLQQEKLCSPMSFRSTASGS